MKLLFLCIVLFLILSFAYGRRYTIPQLETELTRVCGCSRPVQIEWLYPNRGKRETYHTMENKVNEKHVIVDAVNPTKASADDNDEKKRNMIFGNRRKEDGLSFLRKRINKRGAGICCNYNSCVIYSHVVLEECVNEGCDNEEILEVC